jgi:hypothetical protein
MDVEFPRFGVTPKSFVSEVRAFCAFVAEPGPTQDDKRRAYIVIVKHATMLNPRDAGYECAGVALKEALSSWLESQPH